MSTDSGPAPALPGPPPPVVWPQHVSCASPHVWSPARSNSTQPQKPPSSGSPCGPWHIGEDGLSQLNDRPTCHVSCVAPPPYADAEATKIAADVATAPSTAIPQ